MCFVNLNPRDSKRDMLGVFISEILVKRRVGEIFRGDEIVSEGEKGYPVA
jgi:hypothetical protein